MGQIDLFASLAALTRQNVESGGALDSQNFIETYLGKSTSGREYLLEESYSFSLRYNNWKYILPHEHVPFVDTVNIEGGYQLKPQLYDLSKDMGEQNNLANENPKILQKLMAAVYMWPVQILSSSIPFCGKILLLILEKKSLTPAALLRYTILIFKIQRYGRVREIFLKNPCCEVKI